MQQGWYIVSRHASRHTCKYSTLQPLSYIHIQTLVLTDTRRVREVYKNTAAWAPRHLLASTTGACSSQHSWHGCRGVVKLQEMMGLCVASSRGHNKQLDHANIPSQSKENTLHWAPLLRAQCSLKPLNPQSFGVFQQGFQQFKDVSSPFKVEIDGLKGPQLRRSVWKVPDKKGLSAARLRFGGVPWCLCLLAATWDTLVIFAEL
jgi:hypothetical protein